MILDSFRQDVRVGLRVLFKDKTFCFLAVLVLGLGIGGATTQFTLVNAIALRGLSFPRPEQLMTVGLIDPQATPQQNNFGLGNIPSAQDYEDLKNAQQSFAMMAAYLNGSTINISYKNNPQRYTGGYVTEDFFKILGVRPIMGRDFTAEDDKPGAEKVAILGHEVSKRSAAGEFDGRPAISPDSLGHAGRGHSRFANRVRERNEHAVRPGGAACKRTGDSGRARCDQMATGPADVDRESGRGCIRSVFWNPPRLLGSGFVYAHDERSAVSFAILDSIHDLRARARVHRGHHGRGHHRIRSCPSSPQRSRQSGRNDERGRA